MRVIFISFNIQMVHQSIIWLPQLVPKENADIVPSYHFWIFEGRRISRDCSCETEKDHSSVIYILHSREKLRLICWEKLIDCVCDSCSVDFNENSWQSILSCTYLCSCCDFSPEEKRELNLEKVTVKNFL